MSDIADQQEINRLNARIEALVKERDEARAERDQADRDRAQAIMGRAELLLRAEAAEAEVKRLTSVLEFYSREANYEPYHDDPEVPGAIAEPEVLQDRGWIARKALEAKP